MKIIKAVIGTTSLISLNNLGLLLILNTEDLLKIIGYFNYFTTAIMLYLIIIKYFESPFYKSLKYPWEEKNETNLS